MDGISFSSKHSFCLRHILRVYQANKLVKIRPRLGGGGGVSLSAIGLEFYFFPPLLFKYAGCGALSLTHSLNSIHEITFS